MRQKHWTAGWTRIGVKEFQAAIMTASAREPDLCQKLAHAIKVSASRRRVEPEIVNQYLGYVRDVEQALAALAEAEKTRPATESASASAPTGQPVPAETGA